MSAWVIEIREADYVSSGFVHRGWRRNPLHETIRRLPGGFQMNRVTILSRTILMVLGAGALVMAAGCGDSGTPDGDADVVAADVAADTADVAAPDTTDTTQGDMVGDSDDDVAQDAAEDSADGSMGDAGDVAGDLADDIPGVDVVNPDEIFQPIQDREFAQEINHTGIEIDRRITDIVRYPD